MTTARNLTIALDRAELASRAQMRARASLPSVHSTCQVGSLLQERNT